MTSETAKARASIDRWSRSKARFEARLVEAKAAGDPETIASTERSLERVAGFLVSAEARLVTAPERDIRAHKRAALRKRNNGMAKSAEKVGAKLKPRLAELPAERSAEAKRAKARKRAIRQIPWTHGTPERALLTGVDAEFEEVVNETCPHCGSILVVVNNLCQACGGRALASAPRRRVFDGWPLKRLQSKGLITGIKFEAGRLYYEHWYFSGLSPIGATDMSRLGRNGDSGSVGIPASVRQAMHRKLFRHGSDSLGTEFKPYVDGIVLREEDPEVVARRLTGRMQLQQSRAVAVEFLKSGLDRLAVAYGLIQARAKPCLDIGVKGAVSFY